MPTNLVLHGPNRYPLGERAPNLCGRVSLADADPCLMELRKPARAPVTTFQANAEAQLIERNHAAKSSETARIIANPATFRHSNVHARGAPWI